MDRKVYEFISTQTNDPIIEWKTCKWTGKEFAIFQSEKDLLNQISPSIGGEKYDILTPSLSPEARQINRMLFRNDRVFYKGKSDYDSKGIISIYYTGFPGKVYEVNDWYKDIRNPMDYAKEIGDSPNILEIINDMMLQIPRLNVDGVGNTNSDYCNYCGYCKDCYMDIAGENNESCYYCLFTKYSKKCVDCTFVYNSEYCYECISSHNCNKTVYSQYLENCHNCHFSFDLKNCNNCLRCWNLRNQDYCIFNHKVSKEEFHQQVDQIINGGYQGYLAGIAKYNEIKSQFIYPATFKINAEKTLGNNVKDIKNSKFLFNVSEVEDSLYLYDVLHAKNCSDLNYSLYHPEFSYQLISTLELKKSICNFATHHSHNVFYCQLCNNCADCFGCIGLSNKSYCIFNKQYSKEEYEVQLGKIIGKMIKKGERGNFFLPELSPHPYNDTVAIEYYPIKEVGGKIINPEGMGKITLLQPEQLVSDAILDLGGEEKIKIKRRTENQEVNIPAGIETIQEQEIENTSKEDILKKAIICNTSGRPFRIAGSELDFYEKMKLPIPHKHHDIRHMDRIKIRPKRDFSLRQCDKTGKDIVSVYEENVPFKVYAEESYNKEIYG